MKDIDTLEPKGIGKGFHRGVWWNAIKTTSEERQTLSHQFVYRTELGKTKLLHLFFLQEQSGKKVAKPTEGNVVKRYCKKRKLCCNDKDRGSNFASLERGQTYSRCFITRTL